MMKKHHILAYEFNPDSVEESFSKFGVAPFDHVGQKIFKELYERSGKNGCGRV